MAVEFADTAKNSMLAALTPNLIKLHTADPGTAGTLNPVTGTGAAGVAATFSAAASGERVLASDVNFSGGTANGPVTFISIWNTGTFIARSNIESGDQQFNAAGDYRVLATSTKLKLSDP